ncbi:phage tail domain-containing protein [Salinicoccus albus]|uniref:phage tail domain-containing protein n=1 Tax=Salinicoccus albus TaxID=418756 RepID=UPI00036B7339|nr:phage tail domain-containing protein [Salinicoccus albus]
MNYVNAEIIKDGTSYLVSDNQLTGSSLEVLSFVVGGIGQSQHFNDSIDGRSRLFAGSEDKYRKITLNVRAVSYDIHDIAHLRDAVNNLFSGEYYVREKRIKSVDVEYESPGEKTGDLDLGESYYVNGRQYKVTKVNVIETEDLTDANFTVELETTDLPYAGSIYTTLELHDTGYSATAEKYGLVDNIDDEKKQYRFTENEFMVYNAGNVTVEPESMMLNIFVSYVQSSGDFTIRNITTGEEIILKRESNGSHFRIQGMVISLGSITNIFRDTNRRFISLAPGDNEFEVSGGSFSQISFDFKYLYK